MRVPGKKDSFLHKVSMNDNLLVLLKEFYKWIILQEFNLVYMDFESIFFCLPKWILFSIHILKVSYGMTNLFYCCTTKSVLCKYVQNTNGFVTSSVKYKSVLKWFDLASCASVKVITRTCSWGAADSRGEKFWAHLIEIAAWVKNTLCSLESSQLIPI